MNPKSKIAKSQPILASFLLITLLTLTNSSFAVANQTSSVTDDNKQPVKITADNLKASDKKGKSIYSGNVEVTQGSLVIKGDIIEVFHPDGQFGKAITTGSPATFKRFDTVEQSWVYGQAQSIDYDTQGKTVHLKGQAQVEQPGKHVIKGDELFYDINKQILNAKSTKDSKQRVTVTFTPQKDSNNTAE